MAENDMEAIDIISRVATAATALRKLSGQDPESQNQLMRGMLLRRELEGPSEREKFNFEQGKFAEQQRTEQVKYTLSKFSELAKEASPATKSVMMGHIESLWSVMSPIERTASKMIYDHSPMNPIEQKATYWDSTMKAPQVNAEAMKDPYAFGQQLFNLDDYHQQRQNFLTGVPIQKRKIIGIGGDTFAYRGDDDKVSILSTADMALQQTAKEFGTTPGALLTSGGKNYGPERELGIAGHTFKVRSVYNAIERKAEPTEYIPVKTGERDLGPIEEKLRDFSTAYMNKDTSGKTDGSKLYNVVKARMDEGKPFEWIVENIMKVHYPGFNFALVDQGTFSSWPIWGGYAPSDTEVMTFWKGGAISLPAKDSPAGEGMLYYYDHSEGKVFDRSGRMVSDSLPTWATHIGSMTREELKTAATKGKTVAPVAPQKKAEVVKPRKVEETADQRAEVERERRFQEQTKKISENLKAMMKWIGELSGRGSISRIR
jgi:hypothetical protein